MKTIIKNSIIERENNEDAEFKVKHQGWKYIPKSEWKTNVRDINKKVELSPLPEIYAETDKIVSKKKFYQKPKRS